VRISLCRSSTQPTWCSRSVETLKPLYEQLARESVLSVKAEQIASFLGRQISPQLHQQWQLNPDPARQSNALLNLTARIQWSCPPPTGRCHLYFARRVTFLSCVDTACIGSAG
jgi:hypothetical protein